MPSGCLLGLNFLSSAMQILLFEANVTRFVRRDPYHRLLNNYISPQDAIPLVSFIAVKVRASFLVEDYVIIS